MFGEDSKEVEWGFFVEDEVEWVWVDIVDEVEGWRNCLVGVFIFIAVLFVFKLVFEGIVGRVEIFDWFVLFLKSIC